VISIAAQSPACIVRD